MTTSKFILGGTPFRYETELRDPVASWIQSDEGAGPMFVADEVGPRYARADLVAGRRTGLVRRASSLIRPVLSRSQLAVLDYLRVPRDEMALRAWSRCSWRALRAGALAPLAADGLVSFDGERWSARSIVEPFGELVTVELKLRDSERAFSQATLHRLFANAAYVAMPSDRLCAVVSARAERVGVGLLAVERDGLVRCLVQPERREPLDDEERRLAGEVLLAAYLGQRDAAIVAGAPTRRRAHALVSA